MYAIQQITLDQLGSYGQIAIAYETDHIYQIVMPNHGLGGLQLEKVQINPALKIDADGGGNRPLDWVKEFDMAHWGIFLALDKGEPVGGAIVAVDTPGVNMLEGKNDLAVLWDLRVRPEYRSRGVGTALFQHGVQWARQKGCNLLKIETQNLNPQACHFYAKQGCELGQIHRYAYGFPKTDGVEEAMLIWYLCLSEKEVQ